MAIMTCFCGCGRTHAREATPLPSSSRVPIRGISMRHVRKPAVSLAVSAPSTCPPAIWCWRGRTRTATMSRRSRHRSSICRRSALPSRWPILRFVSTAPVPGSFAGRRRRSAMQPGRALLHPFCTWKAAKPLVPISSALETFYAAGLRSLGPVWSRHNVFAHGVPFAFPMSPDTAPGLTEAGFELVKACNRLGILIDLAHITEKGFWDVAKTSDQPLVASHSNAHALTAVARNLTDKQLDAVTREQGARRPQLRNHDAARRRAGKCGDAAFRYGPPHRLHGRAHGHRLRRRSVRTSTARRSRKKSPTLRAARSSLPRLVAPDMVTPNWQRYAGRTG